MILQRIKPCLGGKQCILYFSNNRFLPISPDDLFILKLTSGQSINHSLYQKILDSSLIFLLKSYALRQLAISPKSEKTLRLKLEHRFPQAKDCHIDQTIRYLRQRNLLHQQQFLTYFLKRHSRKSARHLQYLLRREGIRYSPPLEDEVPKILKILQHKKNTSTLLSQYPGKIRLMSSLLRRGFSLNDVKTAIDEFLKSR